jgi:hypothetical protein
MSITFTSRTTRNKLVAFLSSEYQKDTRIPVHLFSVVNADFTCFNRSLAITDNDHGTIFLEESKSFKSYGSGNPFKLVKVLNQCNVGIKCID